MRKKIYLGMGIWLHLTSVYIEELVKVGAIIKTFFKGFTCDNLGFNLFEKFILDMTEKKLKEMKTLKRISAKKLFQLSVRFYYTS